MTEIVLATVVKVYAEKGVNYLNVSRDDNGVGISDVSISTWMAGKTYGCVYVPPIGQQVVVGILNQVTQQAVCLGCVYNEINRAPMQVNAANSSMCITYGNAWSLTVDMQKGKETLILETQKKDKVFIDQAKRVFSVKSADGSNKIELDCTSGKLQISALNQISISVGPSNEVKIDKNGVEIKGTMSVKAEASTVALKGRAQLKVEGNMVSVKGGLQTTVGGGIVQVKGNATTSIG